jgi:hypothetical protein
MSSRLERKLTEAMAAYEALPQDYRQRFEASLVAAKDALAVSEELKLLAPHLGRLWMDCGFMVLSDGKIGGNWNKVHVAMAAAAPRLYSYLEKIIPRDDALSDVGL